MKGSLVQKFDHHGNLVREDRCRFPEIICERWVRKAEGNVARFKVGREFRHFWSNGKGIHALSYRELPPERRVHT